MGQIAKKKIILITYDRASLDYYLNELKNFFENSVEFDGCCICEGINKRLVCDLILTISPIVSDIFKKSNYLDVNVLQGSRTILLESYDKLKSFPC